MDLFGGYGSDSDNESPNVLAKQPALVQAKLSPQIVQTRQPVPRTNPNIVVSAASSKPSAIGQQKKVKKLDISFLPPEIQAALARGDSTRDSDDDETGPVNVAKTSVNKANSKPLDEASCKLLGMLPAPKGHDVESTGSSSGISTNSKVTAAPLVPTSVATTETATTAKPAAPKSAFSFGYSSTETVRSGQGKTSSVSVSVESKPEVPVMPWFQDIQKPIEATRRVTPFAVAPPAQSFTSGLTNPSSNHLNNTIDYGASSSSSNQPAQPARQSYQEYMQQTAAYSAQHDAHYEQPSQKKRKDRDFELQLMSGDLSGMETTAVKDISVQNKWDELRYTEQQQREQEVQRGFGIGVNKNLSMVSKQQSRKHQLSSLAIKAAETELAMLEKRGARNLTKSETQGKYGW